MKIKKNIWEETYGGKKYFLVDVSNFTSKFEFIKLIKREYINIENNNDLELVINTTLPYKVTKDDWTILQITKKEYIELKKESIKKIMKKMMEVLEKISSFEEKYHLLSNEILVKFSFDILELKSYDYYIPKFNGGFYKKTTLLQLMKCGIINQNNYNSWNLYKKHYCSRYGQLDILDEKCNNFINNLSYRDSVEIFNKGISLYSLYDAYHNDLKEIINLHWWDLPKEIKIK